MFVAAACHVVASACPLDPERAVRALFKIAFFDIGQEYSLLLTIVTRLVLFASLPFMKVNFTCKAIAVFTQRATEFWIVSAVKCCVNKCVGTVRRRTPHNIFVLIDDLLECEVSVLLVKLF